MFKYNRSTKLLITTVDELLNYPWLSPDSIAILLMLAASLPKQEFDTIIDYIPQLNPINSKLKTIHNLRQIIGDYSRDYIMLKAMQAKPDKVSSSELQQYIANVGQQPTTELSSTNLDTITAANINQIQLAETKTQATWFLNQHLANKTQADINTINQAFIYCRKNTDQTTAFYAVVYAIADLLNIHLPAEDHWQRSLKLTSYALRKSTRTESEANQMLFQYKPKNSW